MKRQTILIVDDEEINIRLLERMLIQEPYEIVSALSGEEVLEVVFKISPDLILLDVMMSGIDGFEVCRKLKKQERTKLIPILMVPLRR